MNGYLAFYNGRKHEVQADSLWTAKQAARLYFNPPRSKAHMISVVLCERADGSTVTHSTGSI
jgi:hypothetical protein